MKSSFVVCRGCLGLFVCAWLCTMQCSVLEVCAQQQPATAPYYNIVRYNDRDFSYLKTDTADHDFFRPLKYIPLSADGVAFLTLGGEWREEYRYYQNENWGDIAPERLDPDGFVWHRFMAHADMRIGKHFRVFGQIKNCLVFSRAGGARPVIDEDTLDLNQAFLEVSGSFGNKQMLMLRLGRQEFNYGVARMLTMRDGINVRQGFDAFTLKYLSPSLQMDVFVGRGVDTKRGIFDDVPMQTESIWGVYAAMPIHISSSSPSPSSPSSAQSSSSQAERISQAEAYYFGFWREAWRFAGVAGAEHRHTFGGRIFSRGREGVNYECEAAYQTGVFAQMPVHAFFSAGSLQYAFPVPLSSGFPFQFSVGAGWSLGSGDFDPEDGVSNAFNPMYPKPLCTFGQALAGTNMIVLQPFLNLALIPDVQIQITTYFLQLMSSNDGLYSVSTMQVRPAPALRSAPEAREVGNQHSCFITWNINRHLRLFVEATYFTAGSYIRLVGTGQNMLYGAAQVQLTF